MEPLGSSKCGGWFDLGVKGFVEALEGLQVGDRLDLSVEGFVERWLPRLGCKGFR